MLPVTIALGLINLSLLINSLFGTLVSEEAPAAIDKAFRIYQLPQGLFSISIATILFPTLARFAARGARDDLRRTMANGVRQIFLLLIPSAVLMAVLAEPITRLVYERGVFDAEATDLVAEAMVWWSISLPVPGREPAVLAHVLQPPAALGHHGPMAAEPGRQRGDRRRPLRAARGRRHRDRHGGRHDRDVRGPGLACCAGSSAGSRAAARWRRAADARRGGAAGAASPTAPGTRSTSARPRAGAQIASVGVAIAAGFAAYAAAVWALRIPEARQFRALAAVGG